MGALLTNNKFTIMDEENKDTEVKDEVTPVEPTETPVSPETEGFVAE